MKIIPANYLEGPKLGAPLSGLYVHLNPGPDAASWLGRHPGPEETARALKLIRSLAPRAVSSPSELAQTLSAHVQAHDLNANANAKAVGIARAAARRGIPCYRIKPSSRWVQFGQGHRRQWISAAVVHGTQSKASEISTAAAARRAPTQVLGGGRPSGRHSSK